MNEALKDNNGEMIITDFQEGIEEEKIILAKKEYIIFASKLMHYYASLYEDAELVRAFDLYYNDYYKDDVIPDFLNNIELDYTELSDADQEEHEEILAQIKDFKQKENYSSTIYDIEKSHAIHCVFSFISLPVDDQKRLLLFDSKYEDLKRLCSKTFLLLRKQKKGEIMEKEILEEKEKILNEAERLRNEVSSYNRQAASITCDIIKAYFKKMGYGENLW